MGDLNTPRGWHRIETWPADVDVDLTDASDGVRYEDRVIDVTFTTPGQEVRVLLTYEQAERLAALLTHRSNAVWHAEQQAALKAQRA